MKKYEIKEIRSVLISVTCDTCGCNCKNIYIDVLLKFSFSVKLEELETICYRC